MPECPFKVTAAEEQQQPPPKGREEATSRGPPGAGLLCARTQTRGIIAQGVADDQSWHSWPGVAPAAPSLVGGRYGPAVQCSAILGRSESCRVDANRSKARGLGGGWTSQQQQQQTLCE